MARMPRISGLDDLGRDPLDEFGDEGQSQPAGPSEFEKMLAQSSGQTFGSVRRGSKVKGRVVSKGASSVFVDIGQRSEAAVDNGQFNAEELAGLALGTELELYVTQLTASEIVLTRALGSKDMDSSALREAMESGLPVEGKVSGENKGGYTVKLASGEGFVPFSQMDLGRGVASDYIGKVFKFRVMRIQGRDVILSRAALLREEQAEARSRLIGELEPGQMRAGKIVKIESFGAFVDLGGINALIPRSEITWSRLGDPIATVQVGDTVQIKILDIKSGERGPRVSASMKQANQDPWETTVDSLAVGQSVKGTVTNLMKFGAFVEIIPGVEGLIHLSEMSAKRRVMQPGEVVRIGETVEVRITAIDRIAKRISLSLKALQGEEIDEAAKAKYLKEQDPDKEHRGVEHVSSKNLGTLGDVFAEALRQKDDTTRQGGGGQKKGRADS